MTNKPISMVVRELKEGLLFQIQDSGLHPTIIELVLKDLVTVYQAENERQYQFESQKYNEMINNKVEEETTEEVTE